MLDISKFHELSENDTKQLLNIELTKIDCQNIFLYMTQIKLCTYHINLVKKIIQIVPIYSYEVKQLMDDNYLDIFEYKAESKKRELLEPVFEERRVKKRNDEKKKIRRVNKVEAKEKAIRVVAEKKEYKSKIDEIYKKIRSQK